MRVFSDFVALLARAGAVRPAAGPGRGPVETAGEADAPAVEVAAPSAVLMEKVTGEVLYAKGEHERRPPASVTKVMTMLLIAEAVDAGEITLEDEVTARPRPPPWRQPGLAGGGRADDRVRHAQVHRRGLRQRLRRGHGRVHQRQRGGLRRAHERARRRTGDGKHAFHQLHRPFRRPRGTTPPPATSPS